MRMTSQYNLNRKTLEIYLSGCYGSCIGCHNPELKDFTRGKSINYNTLYEKIDICKDIIKSVWILGGDPMDQPKEELKYLLKFLNKFDIEIWLWTRKGIDHIDADIVELCDYIKCGAYKVEYKSRFIETIKGGLVLASGNQYVAKIENGKVKRTY